MSRALRNITLENISLDDLTRNDQNLENCALENIIPVNIMPVNYIRGILSWRRLARRILSKAKKNRREPPSRK